MEMDHVSTTYCPRFADRSTVVRWKMPLLLCATSITLCDSPEDAIHDNMFSDEYMKHFQWSCTSNISILTKCLRPPTSSAPPNPPIQGYMCTAECCYWILASCSQYWKVWCGFRHWTAALPNIWTCLSGILHRSRLAHTNRYTHLPGVGDNWYYQ